MPRRSERISKATGQGPKPPSTGSEAQASTAQPPRTTETAKRAVTSTRPAHGAAGPRAITASATATPTAAQETPVQATAAVPTHTTSPAPGAPSVTPAIIPPAISDAINPTPALTPTVTPPTVTAPAATPPAATPPAATPPAATPPASTPPASTPAAAPSSAAPPSTATTNVDTAATSPAASRSAATQTSPINAATTPNPKSTAPASSPFLTSAPAVSSGKTSAVSAPAPAPPEETGSKTGEARVLAESRAATHIKGPATATSNAPEIISSSDEDVVSVPVQPRPDVEHIYPPPFSIRDYKFTACSADLETVTLPMYTSREVNHSHVSNLMSRFEENGFNPVVGSLVVFPLWKNKEPPVRIELDKGNKLIGTSVLVDGQHRLLALDELLDKDQEKWQSLHRRAPVSVVTRKDGEILSFLEVLALSAFFNSQSSAVLPVSFPDLVHASVQSVKILAFLKRSVPLALTSADIVKELKDRKTLGELDDRQIRRYATVAQALAASEDRYKIFKSHCETCEGIGVVHVNSRALLSIKDIIHFQLAFASLRARVVNGVKGSFESLQGAFYGCVEKMFGMVAKTAKHKKMSVQDLMDADLFITAHVQKTVFEYIADTMGRYAIVENYDAADKARLRNLRKKLVDLLGDDIEPQDAPAEQKDISASKASAKQDPAAGSKPVEKPASPDKQKRPRRSTRKRKQTNIDDTVSDEDGAPSDSATLKKGKKGSRNKPKKPKTELSDRSVTAFLQKIDATRIDRILSSIGVQVVKKAQSAAPIQAARREDFVSSRNATTVLAPFYDCFDDTLPNTLPSPWADPRPYEGPQRPAWLRFANKIPSRWPSENPITAVFPWLDLLHIPHEHRAQSVIDNLDILRTNHHIVFWHAAHAFYKTLPPSEIPCVPFSSGETTTAHKLWAAAVNEDDVALEYLGAKREQLLNQGFCILEGFLNDEKIPDCLGDRYLKKPLPPRPLFTSLEQEALESFLGEDVLSDPTARTVWNITQNVSASEDSNRVITGVGRFRMTNYGILERLEKEPSTVWTISARALIDVRIAQCVAALKLDQHSGTDMKRIFIPKTGGRWIIASKDCDRQALHTDFPPLPRHLTLSENKCPGYFTIATGTREVPLWVCSHSHRLVATTSRAKLRAASSAAAVHMIRIPPSSVFIGRGDLHYSGPAYQNTIGSNRPLYYHTYFVPVDSDIPKVLSAHPDFNPPFKSSFEEDSGDDSDLSGTGVPPKVVQQLLRKPASDDEYNSDEVLDSDKSGEEEDDSKDGDVDFTEYI